MLSRAPAQYRLICPGCEANGVVNWDEPADKAERISDRKLLDLDPGFHVQPTQAGPGWVVVVCDNCGTIQPD